MILVQLTAGSGIKTVLASGLLVVGSFSFTVFYKKMKVGEWADNDSVLEGHTTQYTYELWVKLFGKIGTYAILLAAFL